MESQAHEVALVFGREDRGLSNEELQKCTFHVHIPANPEYSSLNLAAAVQVLAYELRMSALIDSDYPGQRPSWDVPPAKASDLELYYEHLEQALVALGFHDRDNPRQTMARLRRLFNRIRPDRMELAIMRGVLTAVQNVVYRLKQSGTRDGGGNKS